LPIFLGLLSSHAFGQTKQLYSQPTQATDRDRDNQTDRQTGMTDIPCRMDGCVLFTHYLFERNSLLSSWCYK